MKTYKVILSISIAALSFISCNDLDLNESQYHSKKYQFSDFPGEGGHDKRLRIPSVRFL